MPYVELDHFKWMGKAVELLAGLGHRKIVMLDKGIDYPHLVMRREGFERAIAESGCEGRLVSLPSYRMEDAQLEFGSFLSSSSFPFSSIICVGDRPTVGVFKVLSDRGVRVPDDVSIVSYSDYAWIDDACGLRFTKVRQSVETLSENACKLLLGRLEGSEIWQDAFIEEGASCKAISEGGRP